VTLPIPRRADGRTVSAYRAPLPNVAKYVTSQQEESRSDGKGPEEVCYATAMGRPVRYSGSVWQIHDSPRLNPSPFHPILHPAGRYFKTPSTAASRFCCECLHGFLEKAARTGAPLANNGFLGVIKGFRREEEDAPCTGQ